MRRGVEAAREVVPWFGTHVVTTAETSFLLQRHEVHVFLEDLPDKYAALLSPLAFQGQRSLSLARHVPVLQRRPVLLHEAGHLFMESADFGVTYNNDDWRSAHEQGADAFATVALLPTSLVDDVLADTIWMRDVEDLLTEHLLDWTDGLWERQRALLAAQNRLVIRSKIGI